MRVITQIDRDLNPHRAVVTIGNFDGLHLGHRQLIRLLRQRSQENGVPSAVVTFSPHPIQVLRPELGLRRLFSHNDLVDQLTEEGVDELVILKFDEILARTPAKSFLIDSILRPMQPSHFVVGYDFRFGNEREGDLSLFYALKNEYHFSVEQAPVLELNGRIISSSLIRKALAEGQVEAVSEMLGRPFVVTGKVTRGKKLGRTLGFATANLEDLAESLPKLGVYVGQVGVGEKSYSAMINVGVRPTVDEDARGTVKVEAHLLDFEGNLYDQFIKVKFFHRLRDEKKFSNIDDLRTQLTFDEKQARNWFCNHSNLS